jgi:RHH-type transcriptional regulator, proline utilization regulon repressor / proline dehydrogenase / delta 1-pyrroline-5-carboxylate dehydrogenase
MSSIFETDTQLDQLALTAISRTKELMAQSDKSRDRREKANRKRVARLFKDPQAIEATITLTDEVMRISSVKSSSRIFRRAAKKASIVGFGPINGIGLHAIGILSYILPAPVVAAVHQRVRALSKDLILASESEKLSKHLIKRTEKGISLNINVLGEAVLGDHEAELRFQSILEMMRRPEVNYISVKLSSIVAQLIIIDIEGSIDRVSEKMRILYRDAIKHGVFVNLDMEEYRDLPMTVAAFMRVLDEDEFAAMKAGIVLQAYLPESHHFFGELVTWAKNRFEKSGGTIKVRLVKGANLAMERAEAELHGWSPAPYQSKSDVDASFARLVDAALRPEHSKAVRIGIASHNLFHMTWALEVAKARGVIEQIDIEMLEGMANAEALAVTRAGQPVLLYAPVTRKDDFAAAAAYLVRRLDENTSDENYLKAAFEISKNPEKFAEQEERFLNSISERHAITTESLRHIEHALTSGFAFENERNADPTEPVFIASVTKAIKKVKAVKDQEIPLVIAGKEIFTKGQEEGTDPSDDGKVWYHYSVGSIADVDNAIATAKSAQIQWSSLTIEERTTILFKAATAMQRSTPETIAVMSRDAGKTVAEADPEVAEAIDFARFYATAAQNFGESTPLGTILVVPPWNFPYAIPMGGVCAALAAGNSVILKPAPETVATAWEIVSHLWAGGVPKDVLQFLPMRDDESGKYLVTHTGIDGLILTGSFDTASLFTSWRPEINLMAETSGKNAVLITACADIDAAVKDLVQSAFGHAGQKCSAASIAIVDTNIYNDPAFIRQLKDAVESLKVGAGWDFATTVGPIIRPAEVALTRALTQLEQGETWLVEPRQLDDAGLQWRPGVKLGVKAKSWSHQNEWFGPVLAVIESPDFNTGINWQNDTDFGLTAGIQSLDEKECEEWINRIEAGNIYVNRGITGAIVNRQPFGGWKRSAVGPNAKAGGLNYVNTLRNWPAVTNLEAAVYGVNSWWAKIGSQAIDRSGLIVEKNFQRYRHYLAPILVVVDESTSQAEKSLIHHISETTGAETIFTTDLNEVTQKFSRVRWLASSKPPIYELLQRGISVDHRPVAQRGDIEAPRWLIEQSVSITYHRYGNPNGGPKPACSGLSA